MKKKFKWESKQLICLVGSSTWFVFEKEENNNKREINKSEDKASLLRCQWEVGYITKLKKILKGISKAGCYLCKETLNLYRLL